MSYDVVKNPSHYTEGKRFEPKDVIRDWELNFNLGNTVKYIARAGKKDDILQELKKAKQYLEFEIEAIEAERKGTRPVYDEDVNEEEEKPHNLCDECFYPNLAVCPSFGKDAEFSGEGVVRCKHFKEDPWKDVPEDTPVAIKVSGVDLEDILEIVFGGK